MLKRTVAILATTACLGLLVAPQAQAAPPSDLESYAAGSSAVSLLVSLLGNDAAASVTTAAVSSDKPSAAADGAALLLLGSNTLPGQGPAAQPDGETHGEDCVLPVDLAELTAGLAGGLTIDIACVENDASTADGTPAGSSESGEIVITLQGLTGDLLEPVLAAILPPLLDGVTQITDPICVALGPLCDLVNQVVEIDIPGLIDEILDDLDQLDNGLFTIAQITVAPSAARDSATGEDGVVAEAGSTGATIKLFPGITSTIEQLTGLDVDGAADGSLLSVTLGNATAQVTRDPQTGAASTDGSAAQLLSANLTDSLGILSELVGTTLPDVLDGLTEAGAALSCDGGALADILCVDLGTVNDLDQAELEERNLWFGEGTKGVEATAAGIQVLPIVSDLLGDDILGGEVLSLQLSQADAAANAVPAQDEPTTTTTPDDETPQPLPHTGGSNAFPMAMALLGAATISAYLVRRTRTV